MSGRGFNRDRFTAGIYGRQVMYLANEYYNRAENNWYWSALGDLKSSGLISPAVVNSMEMLGHDFENASDIRQHVEENYPAYCVRPVDKKRYRVARYKSADDVRMNSKCHDKLVLFDSSIEVDISPSTKDRFIPHAVDGFPEFHGKVNARLLKVVYGNLVNSMDEAIMMYGRK